MASKAYIGIDPGVEGGMALLMDGIVIEVTAMPRTVKEIAEWFDDAVTRCTLNGIRPALIVEYQQPMPQKFRTSVKATANMMRKFGQWEVIAYYLTLPYHEVTPATWKKAMGVTSDKATAIELCQRLFPGVNLVQERCRKAHDGIAEAILIAEWARRAGL